MLKSRMPLQDPWARRAGLWGSVFLIATLVGCEVTYFPPPEEPTHHIGDVALTKIESVNSESMAVVGGAAGAVWVVSKYDVLRFLRGDLEKRQVILDPQRFQKRFGSPMNGLSSAFWARDGVLWVGSWQGEVYSFKGATWNRFIPEDYGLNGKISAVVLNDAADEMWLGARNALWQVVKKGNQLDFVLEKGIDAVALGTDGSVAAGTFEGVYRHWAGENRLIWRTGERDDSVTALVAQDEGWWVGTHNGFVEIGLDGEEYGRSLPGRWITAFVDHPKGRIVGAWQSGLWLEHNGEWLNLGVTHGLPDAAVSALHVDQQQRLWIGLYGAGTYVADLAGLRDEAVSIGAPEDRPAAP